MAAGSDIKRDIIRRRKEQYKRNQEAIAEAEQRRTEAERAANMRPGDRRRWENRLRTGRQPGPPTIREGHRVQQQQPAPDVDYASEAARQLAEEGGLVAAHFEGVEPSGKNGYTVADVRAILEEQVAGKMQRPGYENKQGDGSEDDEEEEEYDDDDVEYDEEEEDEE